MAEQDGSEKRRRLSRPLVLAAAVTLVDREGLAALTMRRLAADLGVESMAIYRYTPGKEALLDGLVESFFAEVNDRLRTAADTARSSTAHAGPGPGAALPAWRAELRRIARAFAVVAHVHPEILPLVATRPLAVPVARRPGSVLELTEHILAVLGRAGFDDTAALRVYRAFVAWSLGSLLVDKRQVVDNPEEPDPMLRLGLHRLPAADYPRLRALVPRFADYDDERELLAGLDSLLNGLPEAPLDSFYGGSAG
ncbi:TetR/AcrR family transcriptional regulator C-terminal domain-containing protein [Kitasatospora sp. NBC_00240]|uniref:TetR/AcrR family transcriptional regulator C-terminal domain-containing protein n=1 Tax=Kitasatospora sp. NBC_00240 TaxID=2903567 RepID=UPI00224F7196|nr:TetR/AcrR family transcriptional regulator C-terminal domain-containing protein [Kitasatospora sp. NBC_00240]MCX5214582.1 TetR/AcrR family transcriptional regulator C-terminal domain-containing protein [Kitasatospora sp. NBC_00240]